MIANMRVKILKWTEDLTDLSNNFCPFCGVRFQLSDNVVELVTDFEGELGSVIVTVHKNCLEKALEGNLYY
jgi:hypothetical protein